MRFSALGLTKGRPPGGGSRSKALEPRTKAGSMGSRGEYATQERGEDARAEGPGRGSWHGRAHRGNRARAFALSSPAT